MNCPVCQKEMWDNRGKKKNPKQPDFRCKEENCKFSLNPGTGEYETSQYVTSVWLPKEVHTAPVAHPVKKNGDEFVEGKKENTALMCRKDIMVALINTAKDPNDTDLINFRFQAVWETVEGCK